MKVTMIDGLPVVDARRAMTLDVTPKQAATADPKNPKNCALAQACLAKTGVAEVRIHLSRAYVRQDGSKQWTRFIVSPSMRSEIIAFDRGGRFAPGEYTLRRVNPIKRAGADKRKRSGKRNPHAKKRIMHHVTDVRGGPSV